MGIPLRPSTCSRRGWLRVAAGCAGAPAILRGQTASVTTLALTIEPSHEILKIPANYTGLSYESGQLGNPDFFAPPNRALAGFMRRLGSRGVLRIGGNSSEYATWSPDGTAGPETETAVSPDKGGKIHRRTIIRPEAVRNLAAFVKGLGWQLIYGINLGNGNPERAASEAQAVCEAAGDTLLALQIGNEPDLYHKNGLRPENWGFDDYLAQWREFAAAIRKRVPKAPLAAPDVASNADWIAKFAEKGKDEIAFLSGHYYAMGPPTNPAMTTERLLKISAGGQRNTRMIASVSKDSGLAYRMTEGNSCYNGGKPGVSDTFASALWSGDYMLDVAQAGFVGVNLHGGGNGVYTPIAGDAQRGFSARPVYYGMLLAGQFASATIVAVNLDTGANVTAYAAKSAKGLQIAIFNKEAQQPVRIEIHAPFSRKSLGMWRLTAPGLDSKTDVTFGGASVGGDGAWSPAKEETASVKGTNAVIDLPAASAVLIREG